MAIFNVFKKKEEGEAKQAVKSVKKEKPKVRKEAPKKPVKPVAKKPVKKAVPSAPYNRQKKISEVGYKTLKSPLVTEKATDMISKNQYVFKIYPSANKTEIRKAIQDTYGVDVESIRIINIPRKKRRMGRIEGWREARKKAIVKTKEGHKIEVLPR